MTLFSHALRECQDNRLLPLDAPCSADPPDGLVRGARPPVTLAVVPAKAGIQRGCAEHSDLMRLQIPSATAPTGQLR